MLRYSVIVPVFNRPDEVGEFLESMSKQTSSDFEVILVDGSPTDILAPVIATYKDKLPLHYFYIRLIGCSDARNVGCENAKGNYLVFIDSDCIVPPDYIAKLTSFLQDHPVDGFGGPDKADDSFTPVQKAINYAMTSMFTTGGIRGKKTHVGKFQLRGFNMGINKEVFFKVGGFSGMQVAEDIDLSMRLHKAGYSTALIPDAYVYHKRKSNFKKFYKQLFMHGKGRVDLYMKHSDAIKPVHLLPTAFVFFLAFMPLYFAICVYLGYTAVIVLGLYLLAVLVDASTQNKSLTIGLQSTWASLILLAAYGLGLAYNVVKRILLNDRKETIKAAELKN